MPNNAPEKLKCVEDLLCVLNTLDSSKLCVGNGEEWFKAISDLLKGVFKDRRGLLLCCYVICILD